MRKARRSALAVTSCLAALALAGCGDTPPPPAAPGETPATPAAPEAAPAPKGKAKKGAAPAAMPPPAYVD